MWKMPSFTSFATKLVCPDDIPTAYKSMLAGGIAGSVAKTATAPLSRITILYQVSSIVPSTAANVSPSLSAGKFTGPFHRALHFIVKKEGFFALWKGNFTSVLHRFPYSAINFSTFERVRNFLLSIGCQDGSWVRLASGAAAGATACVACYPLDLVRTRLTIIETSTCGLKPAGIMNSFRSILEHEGFWGLYRGVGISMAVAVPNLAIGFMVYGFVKEKMLSRHLHYFQDPVTGHITSLGSMLGGAVAGLCTSSIIFPVDVVRRRLQVIGALHLGSNNEIVEPVSSNSTSTEVNPRKKIGRNILSRWFAFGSGGNVVREVRRIMHQDGIGGFYRGIVPELLKVCPMIAITFCTYEFVLEKLDVPKCRR